MEKYLKILVFTFMSSFIFATIPAQALDLNKKFVVGGDIGFDLDPDLLASALVAEYHVTSNVAFGPYITLGMDSDNFYYTTSGIAKYKANLNESAKLKPYGMLGIGFMIRNEKKWGDWERETDFFFPVGGGFEYWWNDYLAWGGNMLFNISDDLFISLFFGIRTNF